MTSTSNPSAPAPPAQWERTLRRRFTRVDQRQQKKNKLVFFTHKNLTKKQIAPTLAGATQTMVSAFGFKHDIPVRSALGLRHSLLCATKGLREKVVQRCALDVVEHVIDGGGRSRCGRSGRSGAGGLLLHVAQDGRRDGGRAGRRGDRRGLAAGVGGAVGGVHILISLVNRLGHCEVGLLGL
jgi:hypothetical protein